MGNEDAVVKRFEEFKHICDEILSEVPSDERRRQIREAIEPFLSTATASLSKFHKTYEADDSLGEREKAVDGVLKKMLFKLYDEEKYRLLCIEYEALLKLKNYLSSYQEIP